MKRRRRGTQAGAPLALTTATLLGGASLLTACAGADLPPAAPLGEAAWELQLEDSGGFIGLSVVDSATVWAAGSGGRVAHTSDGGATWRVDSVPGAADVQFRDVHAFSDREAFVLSIGFGPDSRIYLTTDGGSTWTSAFQNPDSAAFFDCLSFWSRQRGIVYGDGRDGEFELMTTVDGGASWSRVDPAAVPDARPGEGAFASSGTCVVTRPGGLGWFVTGASGVDTRVIRTADYGASWTEAPTPLASSGPTSGIYSLAFLDDTLGVAVGGDYGREGEQSDDVALTRDGGVTWRLGGRSGLGGAVYGVSWIPGAPVPALVAVSPAGSVLSRDGGRSWVRVDTVNAWAVAFDEGRQGWSAGATGVRRLRWR